MARPLKSYYPELSKLWRAHVGAQLISVTTFEKFLSQLCAIYKSYRAELSKLWRAHAGAQSKSAPLIPLKNFQVCANPIKEPWARSIKAIALSFLDTGELMQGHN